MNTTTLQVPISKDLKLTAGMVAQEYGFSSLQEFVRLLLNKLAKRELVVRIEEKPLLLSKKAEDRYQKMTSDFKAGKNIYKARNVNDLMAQLKE